MHRVLMYGEGEVYLGCFSEIKQREKVADYFVREFVYADSQLLNASRKKFTVHPARQQWIGEGFSTVRFGLALQSSNALASDYGLEVNELEQYVIDFYCDSAWAKKVEKVAVWYDHYLAQEFVNDGSFTRRHTVSQIPNWPEEGKDLIDRPAEYWNGWSFELDRVCKRRRVGEHDY